MIRFVALELTNFRGVKHGKAELSAWKKGNHYPESDIVGIYGQNASGKTSIVKALEIIKAMFTGLSAKDLIGFNDCIQIGETSAKIKADFLCSLEKEDDDQKSKEELHYLTYELRLSKVNDEVIVSGEQLGWKDLANEKSSSRTLIKYDIPIVDIASDHSINSIPINSDLTGMDQHFKTDFVKRRVPEFTISPVSVWSAITKMNESLKMELLVAQRIVAGSQKSLIFSLELLQFIKKVYEYASDGNNKLSKKAHQSIRRTITPMFFAVHMLRQFSLKDFTIVESLRQAGTFLNRLRISTHDNNDFVDDFFELNIESSMEITYELYGKMQNTIDEISPVLESLVPGLQIKIENIGNCKLDDGSIGVRAEVVSRRGGVTVPFRCESDGIKKLVTILVLLIDVYSKPGACVVIDEFDSSIFEFLLGELIQVLDENGRGQLIFTAHNLRPLEVLGSSSLIFTTTNEKNRYIRFKGMHSTNNLRDQYLRALNLGGLPETIYEATNKFDIDDAFYAARACKEQIE